MVRSRLAGRGRPSGLAPRFVDCRWAAGARLNAHDFHGPSERVERSLYQHAVGYNYEAVKIFMPANRAKPVYAKYIEHIPPDETVQNAAAGAASVLHAQSKPSLT